VSNVGFAGAKSSDKMLAACNNQENCAFDTHFNLRTVLND